MMKLIETKAEERFLVALESDAQSAAGRGVLVCRFSTIELVLKVSSVVLFLKDLLRDYDGELYFCVDGDVLISWRGRIREVMEAIIAAFTLHYPNKISRENRNDLFLFYDKKAQDEELRLLLRNKLQKIMEKMVHAGGEEHRKEAPEGVQWNPVFTQHQLVLLQSGVEKRRKRGLPELLVVEDQDFSRRLLLGLLEKYFVCHSATTAQQAVTLYAEHVPNISFLDVELPGASGHQLASLFKKLDPDGYVVMVTANHYTKDVEMAKANKVQGFIAKPFNKQKIIEAIEAYSKWKK